jgi:CRP/FNR family transcriptional regulator, cyclic AMP receptor protein
MTAPAAELLAADSSFLDLLSPPARQRIVAGATERTVRAGRPIFPPRAAWTRAGMVLEGIARAYLDSNDGRQVTIRYVRPGGTIGNVFPIAGDRAPLAIKAVTDCRILEFDPSEMLRIISSDAATGVVILTVLSQRLEDLYATLAASAFGTMRERIAGHLLEMAHTDQESGRIVVSVTQQRLADDVGTVREVVARTLREFRDDGLVETLTGTVVILDAPRLASLVGRWRTRPLP